MKNRINTLKYGEISSRYADNITEGELLKLKNNSLAACQNAFALGYDGVQQRNGWQLQGAIFDSAPNFVTFEVKFQDGNAILFVAQQYLLLWVPDVEKYYYTQLSKENWYDYSTVTSVTTDQLSTLFIASSRGLDAWTLIGNIYTSENGFSILKKTIIEGISVNGVTTLNTTFYFVFAKKNLNENIVNINGSNVTIVSNDPVLNQQTLDLDISGVWFPSNGSIQIGTEVSYNFTITKYYIYNGAEERSVTYEYQGTAKVLKIKAGHINQSYARNAYSVIYPDSTVPSVAAPITGASVVNPTTPWTGQTFCKLDIPILFSGLVNSGSGVVTASSFIPLLSPFVTNDTAKNGVSGIWNIKAEFANNAKNIYASMVRYSFATFRPAPLTPLSRYTQCDLLSFSSNTGGFLQYSPSNPTISTLPYVTSYQSRLWLCSYSSIYASEVNNALNFVTDPETKDKLTSPTPIQVTLDDSASIYWIIGIKDLGQLIGTNQGLKLLSPNATSFRLGIISSNSTVPSPVPPVFATINGISGIIFVSFDYSKVLFLQAVSQLESVQMLDLTQFFNAFEADPIKKIISLPFLSDRMTCVLTQGGVLYRLVTGNNDKFSWSRDVYGTNEVYSNFASFPKAGFNKVFYTAEDTGTLYVWLNNRYVEIQYEVPSIFDITTYYTTALGFFNFPAVDDNPPSILIAAQNLTDDLTDLALKTTVDFYVNTPTQETLSMPIPTFTNPRIGGIVPARNLDPDFLQYLLLPSKMDIQTHYDEYNGGSGGKPSKNFNRRIEDLTVTGNNLFNVIIGYNSAKQDFNGNYAWYRQDIYRRFTVQTPISQATNLNGNFAVRPSNNGLRVSIYIASFNLVPTIITSISYSILFP
jgi:hypothetical protein